MRVTVATQRVLGALIGLYSRPEYLIVPEYPVKTGSKKSDCSWIDAVLFYRSNPHRRIAFEIKTTKRDFINELQNPLKRQRAMSFCSVYCFVAPMGLIDKNEIPEDCGFVEVAPDAVDFLWHKMPEEKDVHPLTYEEMFELGRRALRFRLTDVLAAQMVNER